MNDVRWLLACIACLFFGGSGFWLCVIRCAAETRRLRGELLQARGHATTMGVVIEALMKLDKAAGAGESMKFTGGPRGWICDGSDQLCQKLSVAVLLRADRTRPTPALRVMS